MYTDIFCTQAEFRQMFDHTLLDKCRARLKCAGAFPEVYAKVQPEPDPEPDPEPYPYPYP